MELPAGLYCPQCFKGFPASEFEGVGRKYKMCTKCREYIKKWTNKRYHDLKAKVSELEVEGKKQCSECFKIKDISEFKKLSTRYTKLCNKCRS